MSQRMALKVAIDLMHIPSQVRLVRAGPLPDGVVDLLRIAAGDDEARSEASLLTDRSPDIVRQSAAFFIEQILLAPEADSYRILGASPESAASELRRNVALLLRWLHPDLDPHGERSLFAGRVTAAWNDLKTPARRAAYDRQLRLSRQAKTWRAYSGKSKSDRNGSRRQSTDGKTGRIRFGRSARSTAGAVDIGFFRRALSILLQRPPH